MNDKEVQLAEDMHKWGELKKQLDLVQARIETAVLEMQSTQGIGDVEATFVKPKKIYDYEGAVKLYEGDIDVEAVKEVHTVSKINWYRVSVGLGIPKTDVVYTEEKPKVRVKLR